MHISVTSLEKGLKASFFKALAEQPDPIAPKIPSRVTVPREPPSARVRLSVE
mgnify:CR=1 FL=1